MIYIQNEYIKAGFSEQGAEMQILESKITNINYLWNGNPEFWAKRSPVLFPIVGGLKDHKYYYENTVYELPRHGFARDQKFKSDVLNDNQVVFTLKNSKDTLQVYPFEFELKLIYHLDGPQISCTYHVVNTSQTKELLFSIGGHPAFSTPAELGINYSDYYLVFNEDSELVYHKLQGDLISDETSTIELQNNELPLSRDLFKNDALVFKNLKSNSIQIRNSKTAYKLEFTFNDFPYFGIWAAKNADFVCLEPWCGIADVIGHNHELSTKEGIVKLSSNQNWQRTWSVKIN